MRALCCPISRLTHSLILIPLTRANSSRDGILERLRRNAPQLPEMDFGTCRDELFASVRSNIKPGFTVALVNIPMSIALAIAAGGTPNAGIGSAFWAGLMSAVFGGVYRSTT